MSLSTDEIALLLSREGSGLTPDEYDEIVEAEGVHDRRAELLAPVLATCQQLWFSGSEELDIVAEKLGDGSRDGILDFFLGIIALDPLRPALQLHTLRLIGNSCADTDENRARVVEGIHLVSIIRKLQDETLIPFTVPVLYNILVDYEPAQVSASRANLNQHLTALLSSPSISNYAPFISYICKTLVLLSTQECEPGLANINTVQILLTLLQNPTYANDLEVFTDLAKAAVSYLASPIFQFNIISGAALPLLLNTFYHAYSFFSIEQLGDEDDASSLKELRAALLKALCESTANDDFPKYHQLGGPVAQTLLSWLESPNQGLQAGACLAMGNLAWNAENCIELVDRYAAHKPLIPLISNPETKDLQVLHGALGFLKNLAIPEENKATLGDLLDITCVPRIFSLDVHAQVHLAAISLTRLLIIHCPENLQRVCRRLSADEYSPSHDRTIVSAICSLFERSDAEPVKVESCRAVLTVCRNLHDSPVRSVLADWDPENPEDIDNEGARREAFYKKHNVSDALRYLVTQSKWPILRSEAWFVFALMCRSKDGGGVIISVTLGDMAIAALIHAITGRVISAETVAAQLNEPEAWQSNSSEAPAPVGLQLEAQKTDERMMAEMSQVDRENAIVMCQEMLKHWAPEMPQLRVSMWQDLIKEGTEIIARERGL